MPEKGLTRRKALLTTGVAGVAAGLGAAGCSRDRPTRGESEPAAAIPFHGEHQAGIATRQQNHLQLAAFDLTADDSNQLRDLLRSWASLAIELVRGRPATAPQLPDPGEAAGLGPARLTVTFGFGPTLFEQHGHDRLGLLGRRPPALRELPHLPGDELRPEHSGGDLCLQICSDDAQVAFHALHTLGLASRGAATLRWAQAGFTSTATPSSTPRNLMGFKDGTNNIKPADPKAMNAHVWVPPAEGNGWMQGGTYLVARRIRLLLDVWDGLATEDQERIIGRHKHTGAPLGGQREADPVDLDARTEGSPTVPVDAHIRLAAAGTNGGIKILRRGYAYSDGVDPYTEQLDAGLLFLCYQRDPHQQFAALQRKLGSRDALRRHTIHIGSAVFACPPGTRPGGFVGERLFG
jgi:deferrochelatase/peroxidase EfeB